MFATVEFFRMGKRKFGGSDSDDTDEEGSDVEEEIEKSVVLNNGNHSDSSKEADGSSGSVTGGKQDDEFSGGASSETGSEEEKEIVLQGIGESSGCEWRESLHADVVEPVIHEKKMSQSTSVPLGSETEALIAEKQDCNGLEILNLEEATGQPPDVLSAGNGEGLECTSVDCEVNTLDSKSKVCEETLASTNTAEMETPLNFDAFNSAAEMEVCYENKSLTCIIFLFYTHLMLLTSDSCLYCLKDVIFFFIDNDKFDFFIFFHIESLHT